VAEAPQKEEAPNRTQTERYQKLANEEEKRSDRQVGAEVTRWEKENVTVHATQ